MLDSGDRSQKAASDEGLNRRLLGVLVSPSSAGEDGEGRKGDAGLGERVDVCRLRVSEWKCLFGERKRSGDVERLEVSSSLSSSDGSSSAGWSSSLPCSGSSSLGDSSGDTARGGGAAYTRLLDALCGRLGSCSV